MYANRLTFFKKHDLYRPNERDEPHNLYRYCTASAYVTLLRLGRTVYALRYSLAYDLRTQRATLTQGAITTQPRDGIRATI